MIAHKQKALIQDYQKELFLKHGIDVLTAKIKFY